MLYKMDGTTLSVLDARHSGYSSKNYLQGKNIEDDLENNTIYSAEFSWIDHSQKPKNRRYIQCEKAYSDQIEKTIFKIKGQWE